MTADEIRAMNAAHVYGRAIHVYGHDDPERLADQIAATKIALDEERKRRHDLEIIDREALAAALHDAYVADEAIVWGERCEDVRQGYRREADTAIRLCAGADAGARIADLEARIATLTATANAAVERAEEAEVRAAKAEKALRLSADAAEAATTDEEDARHDLYEARKENRRLRHALSAALRGAQHIATAADLLLGEENADA